MDVLHSLQHVTVRLKVGSAFNHLIHVTFFKSHIIRWFDELYVHRTLEEKSTQTKNMFVNKCILNECLPLISLYTCGQDAYIC